MTTSADLDADLGIAGGIDSPDAFNLPPTGDRDAIAHFITAMVVDLEPDDAASFLADWQGDGWELLVMIHITHPNLRDVLEWADHHDDVMLLAGSHGPIPPAVLTLERNPQCPSK